MGKAWAPCVLQQIWIFATRRRKKQIAEFMALSAEKRSEMIKEKESEMEKLEADFKAFVEGLQKQYKESSDKKDSDIEAIKKAGLGLLKAFNNHEKKSKSEL